MTRAEKEELMKKWQAERDAAKVSAPVVEQSKPAVKTFEHDGEQIAYEPEKPAKADRSIGNAWKEIARNRD